MVDDRAVCTATDEGSTGPVTRTFSVLESLSVETRRIAELVGATDTGALAHRNARPEAAASRRAGRLSLRMATGGRTGRAGELFESPVGSDGGLPMGRESLMPAARAFTLGSPCLSSSATAASLGSPASPG